MVEPEHPALRPDGAIRLKRVYEPAGGDDGLRLLVTRLWPRGVRRESVDEWVKELGTPRDMLNEYQHGGLAYEEFAVRYRAWLDTAPEAQPVLDRVAQLAIEQNITLLTSLPDLTRSHVPILRGALVDRALRRLGQQLLERTRRFQAVLFHSASATALVGEAEHPDELLGLAGFLMTGPGQELDLGDAEGAEDRSPQCYLGSYSAFGLGMAHGGRVVGAAVAESAQIGAFSAAERAAVRELGDPAGRLLASG